MSKRNHTLERYRRQRLAWARSLPVGRIEGRLRCLEWVGPDRFFYEPDKADPFRYIRHDGEIIEPGPFWTDLGSVAPTLEVVSGVTRTSHVPGWIPHDWDYELKHAGRPARTFEDAALLLAEIMRTMQVEGRCRDALWDIINVYDGVTSPIARRMWFRKRQTALNTHLFRGRPIPAG